MQRKRLLWQLYPTYLLVIVLALFAATWYITSALRTFYLNHITTDLRQQARLIAPQVTERYAKQGSSGIASLCRDLRQRSDARVTVVLPSGVVIGDSLQNPLTMENHSDREEIQQALMKKIGYSMRYSHTLRENMRYVAIPLMKHGKLIAVLRTALPVTSIGNRLHQIDMKFILGGLIIAVLAALVSLVMSRRIARPLEELRKGATLFAQGDLHNKLSLPDCEEIASLATALNNMAEQLDERIGTISRHRNEQEAILSSMTEGVLAVDMNECMISINNAAAAMFSVDPNLVIGRVVQEVIRNAELQQFISETLSSSHTTEGEITLRDRGEQFLQVSGSILRDANNAAIGAVVVLNDVTRIRRLEQMRREFVANVSHELRTPITSIKGFVETLQDGALAEPEDAEHFLQVIAKQVDRLDDIIDDLLFLSTLEQGTERSEIGLETGMLADIVDTAMQVCNMKAQAKGIALSVHCPDDLQACVNPPLLEQALINLVDNAIKYSEPNTAIDVKVEEQPYSIVISVQDTGCGIGKEHLPRLFERFYRVDKARSRKLGGTGLGLSIVKHIAQAHGGHVSVTSTLGKGSVFSIHLPQN